MLTSKDGIAMSADQWAGSYSATALESGKDFGEPFDSDEARRLFEMALLLEVGRLAAEDGFSPLESAEIGIALQKQRGWED